MIKFEHNTLVLNSILSKDDVAEINAFADYIRKQEQERIIKLLEDGLSDYPDAFIQHLVSLIKISGDQE